MLKLTGTLLGGALHAFEGISVIGGNAPAQRNAYCFGIQHLATELLLAHDKGGGGTDVYLPKWLEALARTAGTTSVTAILLEIPPLSPEFIDDPKLEKTVEVTADTILGGCLRRLLPLFGTGSPARKADWILDGVDLRYRYEYSKGQLVPAGRDLRWSVHKNLRDDLAKWTLDLHALRKAYTYLIGMSDDAKRLDDFVVAYCTAAGNVENDVKRKIFAQAAAHCRSVFDGVDEGVKLSVVEFMVEEAKLRMAADQLEYATNVVPKVYPEYGPNAIAYEDLNGVTPAHEFSESIIKYAVAQHLVDLYILGHFFCVDAALKNVVVVVGHEHILTVRKFMTKYRSVVRTQTTWPADSDVSTKITVGPAQLDQLTGNVLQTNVDRSFTIL